MAADKIIRNSKLDTFLSKLATKLTAIFWRKAETTQVSIDNTPTASSNNLVKSGGVYDFVKPEVKSTRPAGGMVAGTTYRLGALSGSVSITFAAPTDNTVVNLYHFTFTTGSTVPQITWPNIITRWAGNCIDASSHIPSLVANGYYEVMFDYASGAGVCNKFEAV